MSVVGILAPAPGQEVEDDSFSRHGMGGEAASRRTGATVFSRFGQEAFHALKGAQNLFAQRAPRFGQIVGKAGMIFRCHGLAQLDCVADSDSRG